LPGSPVSRAESGQVQLATASPKAENSSQALPLLGDWVPDSGMSVQVWQAG